MKYKQSKNLIDRSKWDYKKDYTGEKFGRITLIKRLNQRRGSKELYLCQCECGIQKDMIAYNVVVGRSISCGCYNRENAANVERPNKLPYGESAMRNLYLIYKRGARIRGLTFLLSLDNFRYLTKQNCHYCGTEPCNPTTSSGTQQRNGEYVYNGIDRIDSSKGYETDNMVTCCKICNYAKRDISYDKFIDWINKLVKYKTNEKEYCP